MYPEFVGIYVLLGVVIVLLLALIVLAIVILKKVGSGAVRSNVTVTRPIAAAPAAGGNVVFCRNCAKQFDSSMRFCPHCGTNR